MASLIIDVGHGGSDNGTNGFGVLEKDWNLKMSLYQFERLKELGVNVGITRTTDKSLSRDERTNMIKKYDYCMSNHFNGYNGKADGVETIHSVHENDKIANRLAQAVVDVGGLDFRRVFTKSWSDARPDVDWYYIIRDTRPTNTTIVEYGFMDNEHDHNFYTNDKNFYAVAEAVIKEWCQILGVTYKTKEELETSNKGFYRVITGSFKDRDNAERRMKELKKDGYDSFLDYIKE